MCFFLAEAMVDCMPGSDETHTHPYIIYIYIYIYIHINVTIQYKGTHKISTCTWLGSCPCVLYGVKYIYLYKVHHVYLLHAPRVVHG